MMHELDVLNARWKAAKRPQLADRDRAELRRGVRRATSARSGDSSSPSSATRSTRRSRLCSAAESRADPHHRARCAHALKSPPPLDVCPPDGAQGEEPAAARLLRPACDGRRARPAASASRPAVASPSRSRRTRTTRARCSRGARCTRPRRAIARARPLEGRGIAYAIALPVSGTRAVVRHNRHGGLLAPVTRDLFLPPTRAPHELRTAMRLAALGVPTPPVLMYGVEPAGLAFRRADVVTREVEDARDLSAYLSAQHHDRRARRGVGARRGDCSRRCTTPGCAITT